LFAKDPQDVSVIPSSKGHQYFPAHGRIKNANLVQVDTTGMFARSKATQTRWGFHGRGRMTVGLWYSSLQAVDHGGNDRILKPFSSQQALKIGQGNQRVVLEKYLLDTVIHNTPRKVVVV
jgi:hypothetical protein